MRTKERKPLPLFLVIAVLLFGGMLLAVGFLQRQEGVESANWPIAAAEVTKTDVEHKVLTGTNMATTSDIYYGHITYQYEHAGVAHESTAFEVGGSLSFDTEQQAAAHIANYPVGTKVEVHVNPMLPHMAVVATGVPASASSLIWGGAFADLFGIVLLVEWIRFRRKGSS